jgi:hypothetical protein
MSLRGELWHSGLGRYSYFEDFILTRHHHQIDFEKNPHYAELPSVVLNWCEMDSEKAFADNMAKDLIPEYYKGCEIEYNISEDNLRNGKMNVFNIEDNNNLLVSFGCSHTFGIGNKYEDLYHTKLAKRLDLDNFNFGISGGNLHMILVNSMALVSRGCRPLCVIVQHPEINRKLQCMQGADPQKPDLLSLQVDDNATTEYLLSQVQNNDLSEYFYKGSYANMIDQVWKSVGVPVVHFTFGNDGINNRFADIEIKNINSKMQSDAMPTLARDLAHDGPSAHECAYTYLLPQVHFKLSENT